MEHTTPTLSDVQCHVEMGLGCQGCGAELSHFFFGKAFALHRGERNSTQKATGPLTKLGAIMLSMMCKPDGTVAVLSQTELADRSLLHSEP